MQPARRWPCLAMGLAIVEAAMATCYLPAHPLSNHQQAGRLGWKPARMKPNSWGTRRSTVVVSQSLVWHLHHCCHSVVQKPNGRT